LRTSAACIVVPWMPASAQCINWSRNGSSDDTQEGGSAVVRSKVNANAASSGSGTATSSQPRDMAASRTSPALRRPIRPDRAIARSVSPWRMRTRTCR
jgi:hypothetical protein